MCGIVGYYGPCNPERRDRERAESAREYRGCRQLASRFWTKITLSARAEGKLRTSLKLQTENLAATFIGHTWATARQTQRT